MMEALTKVFEKEKNFFLMPGNIIVSGEPIWVTTILGSCVAVCLWDCEKKIGGINHFLLPFWNGVGLASPKYGNIAIDKLITRMLAYGCQMKNLRAKVFGGAVVLQNGNNEKHVGLKNIAFTKSYLEQKSIPIIAEDLGGNNPRRLKFNPATGVVLVKKISPKEKARI